jgi:hypothetical protein
LIILEKASMLQKKSIEDMNKNKIKGVIHEYIKRLIIYYLMNNYNNKTTLKFLDLIIKNFRCVFDPKFENVQYIAAFCYKLWNIMLT